MPSLPTRPQLPRPPGPEERESKEWPESLSRAIHQFYTMMARTVNALCKVDTAANRPPVDLDESFFYATDTRQFFITSGGAYVSLSPVVAGTVTLGAGVTTFAIAGQRVVTVTGDALGNTIATITGGLSGQLLTLIFVDALVTITDDNTHAADSVDLSAAFTGADDTTLQLVYDGTSWYEISRSTN